MKPHTFPVCVSLIAGCALLLPACGNKGALTLPPPATAAQTKPVAPKSATADSPAKPADLNSPPATAKP